MDVYINGYQATGRIVCSERNVERAKRQILAKGIAPADIDVYQHLDRVAVYWVDHRRNPQKLGTVTR